MLDWCLGNVVGKPDRRGNLYPIKPSPEQKVEAVVTLMMVVGRAMSVDDTSPDLSAFLADPIIV